MNSRGRVWLDGFHSIAPYLILVASIVWPKLININWILPLAFCYSIVMCRKGSLADLAKLAENGKDIAKKLRSGQPALPETSEEGVE